MCQLESRYSGACFLGIKKDVLVRICHLYVGKVVGRCLMISIQTMYLSFNYLGEVFKGAHENGDELLWYRP